MLVIAQLSGSCKDQSGKVCLPLTLRFVGVATCNASKLLP